LNTHGFLCSVALPLNLLYFSFLSVYVSESAEIRVLVSVLDSKIKQFRIQHAAATQLAAVQAKKIAEGTVAAPPPKLNLKERQSLLATLQVCVCVCLETIVTR
jgi:hypothetical protein